MAELADYRVVVFRQRDGSWGAYVPALPGCHAIMLTRDEVLSELELVFEMIREEYVEEGKELPVDQELVCA